MPAINIQLGLTYDNSITSNVRTFGLWYGASHSSTDPTMPIAVYIHGGEWAFGSAYEPIGLGGPITPGICPDAKTAVCDLASLGYAVYSINYTLVDIEDATTE